MIPLAHGATSAVEHEYAVVWRQDAPAHLHQNFVLRSTGSTSVFLCSGQRSCLFSASGCMPGRRSSLLLSGPLQAFLSCPLPSLCFDSSPSFCLQAPEAQLHCAESNRKGRNRDIHDTFYQGESGEFSPPTLPRRDVKGKQCSMPTSASITMMKMIESLPEPVQKRALEHMQQYIEDIRDELKWNESFGKSQNKFIAAARQAREEISRGKATPMNVEDL